jgi:hypothetical protein
LQGKQYINPLKKFKSQKFVLGSGGGGHGPSIQWQTYIGTRGLAPNPQNFLPNFFFKKKKLKFILNFVGNVCCTSNAAITPLIFYFFSFTFFFFIFLNFGSHIHKIGSATASAPYSPSTTMQCNQYCALDKWENKGPPPPPGYRHKLQRK